MVSTLLPDASWHTLIKEQVKETFHYDQRWFELITKLYGYRVIQLTTTDAQGQITGFLPLCSISSVVTGRRLVALPFSDHCPLLATDEKSSQDLIDQAIRLAQQQKVKYLELRAGINDSLAARSDLIASDLYTNWSLPLQPRSEDMWAALRKPVQQQVKKSRKLGVQIRVAQKREDMLLYHRLHLQTRTRKHGMPAQAQDYFLKLWDYFAADGAIRLLLAEHQGTPIAGIILLISGTTIHYAYGASDEAYLHLAPNNLLFWIAIEWGCNQGYRTFDFGRTARDNQGLMEFKRRWGAIQEPLPYYYYPHAAGLAATSETSWKYRLLTNTWKKLPLAITGPLGGYLYRHLG
ncbi:MAG: GNAT family N-acetyltransferase [Ktedonobacteraceae bacterium]|nr:GNAT family N-acetyltransferase [Ktedonobacteraceae bacterium]